jgi:hypothetical protein
VLLSVASINKVPFQFSQAKKFVKPPKADSYRMPGQTKLRLPKRLFKRLRCEFIRLFSHLKRLILIFKRLFSHLNIVLQKRIFMEILKKFINVL